MIHNPNFRNPFRLFNVIPLVWVSFCSCEHYESCAVICVQLRDHVVVASPTGRSAGVRSGQLIEIQPMAGTIPKWFFGNVTAAHCNECNPWCGLTIQAENNNHEQPTDIFLDFQRMARQESAEPLRWSLVKALGFWEFRLRLAFVGKRFWILRVHGNF